MKIRSDFNYISILPHFLIMLCLLSPIPYTQHTKQLAYHSGQLLNIMLHEDVHRVPAKGLSEFLCSNRFVTAEERATFPSIIWVHACCA